MDIYTLIQNIQPPSQAHVYTTLLDFLRANDCLIQRQIDRRPMTHTSYAGGIAHIKEEDQAMFDHLMATDLRQGQAPLFWAELVGYNFRLFCDFDIKMRDDPGDGKALALSIGKLLQEALHKFIPEQHTLVIASAEIKKKTTDGKVWYGPHYHMVWPEVVVTADHALHFREMALSFLNRALPLTEDPLENAWEDRFDEGVYRDKRAGLRMLGNSKCLDCECKKEKNPYCSNAHYGKQKKNVGRPYSILTVLNEEGQELHALTKKLKENFYLSIPLTRVRTEQLERVDFTIPKNCPRPSSQEELTKAKKLRSRPQATSARATKEKRMYRFESSKTLREDYKRKVFLEPKDAIYRELEKVVCSSIIDGNYAELYVTSIFTNTKKTYFVITVDGPGCQYCLNKGANHTGSNIYFYVGSDLTLHQRCLSPKKEIRPCGKRQCSEWRSRHVPLPVHLQEIIRHQRKGTSEQFKKYAHRQQIGDSFVKMHTALPSSANIFTSSDVRRIFSDPLMATRIIELQEKAKKVNPKVSNIST